MRDVCRIGAPMAEEFSGVACPYRVRNPIEMTNFLFGLMAGGIVAGVSLITAARHPAVQVRLGLVPPAQAAVLCPERPPETRDCPAPRIADQVGKPEMLFSRRRLWSVAP